MIPSKPGYGLSWHLKRRSAPQSERLVQPRSERRHTVILWVGIMFLTGVLSE